MERIRVVQVVLQWGQRSVWGGATFGSLINVSWIWSSGASEGTQLQSAVNVNGGLIPTNA